MLMTCGRSSIDLRADASDTGGTAEVAHVRAVSLTVQVERLSVRAVLLVQKAAPAALTLQAQRLAASREVQPFTRERS